MNSSTSSRIVDPQHIVQQILIKGVSGDMHDRHFDDFSGIDPTYNCCQTDESRHHAVAASDQQFLIHVDIELLLES